MRTTYNVDEWSKQEKRWIPYLVTEDKEKAYKVVEQNSKDNPRTKWRIWEMTTTVIYETARFAKEKRHE